MGAKLSSNASNPLNCGLIRVDSGCSLQEIPGFSGSNGFLASDMLLLNSIGIPLDFYHPTNCTVRFGQSGILCVLFTYSNFVYSGNVKGKAIGNANPKLPYYETTLTPRKGEILRRLTYWANGDIVTALELCMDSGRTLLAGIPSGKPNILQSKTGNYLTGFEGTFGGSGYLMMLSAYEVSAIQAAGLITNKKDEYFKASQWDKSLQIGEKGSDDSSSFDDVKKIEREEVRLDEIILYFDHQGPAGVTLNYTSSTGEKVRGGSSETEEPNNLEFFEFKRLKLGKSEVVVEVSGHYNYSAISHIRFSTNLGRVLEAGLPEGYRFGNILPRNCKFIGLSGHAKARIESICAYFIPI